MSPAPRGRRCGLRVGAPADDELVAVPAGRVVLSDRRTQRSWPVEVPALLLAAVPVTRARYADVTGQHPGGAGSDRLPVVEVSWVDAVRSCNALSAREGLEPAYRFGESPAEEVTWDASADGYRLPTEAEWEHACRAGGAGPRYGPLDEVGWYRGNSGERIREVGGERPDAWGLHDVLGGVWEWCWDLYDPEVYGSYRVLRGGGWFDEPWSCRASVRRRSHPTLRLDDVGFRVARSPRA